MDLSVSPTRCAIYYTVVNAPREDRLLSPKELAAAGKEEAVALFNLLEHGHALESLRETIGLSRSLESELRAFINAYPEEAAAIKQAIELRSIVLSEFDRLVEENPSAVPIVPAASSTGMEPAPPQPTAVAQRLLDVLDGLDQQTARRALHLAVGAWYNTSHVMYGHTG
jgi:hypothetical protein